MTKQKKYIITQIEPPFHCEHERELTNEKIDHLVKFLLVCEIKIKILMWFRYIGV